MLRRLVPFLVITLLLQWSAAVAGACATAPEPLASAPICSSHGSSQAPAKPPPGKPAPHADQCCPACHQLPVLPGVEPVAAAPAGAWRAPPNMRRPAPFPSAQARAPPPIRGPPPA